MIWWYSKSAVWFGGWSLNREQAGKNGCPAAPLPEHCGYVCGIELPGSEGAHVLMMEDLAPDLARQIRALAQREMKEVMATNSSSLPLNEYHAWVNCVIVRFNTETSTKYPSSQDSRTTTSPAPEQICSVYHIKTVDHTANWPQSTPM